MPQEIRQYVGDDTNYRRSNSISGLSRNQESTLCEQPKQIRLEFEIMEKNLTDLENVASRLSEILSPVSHHYPSPPCDNMKQEQLDIAPLAARVRQMNRALSMSIARLNEMANEVQL